MNLHERHKEVSKNKFTIISKLFFSPEDWMNKYFLLIHCSWFQWSVLLPDSIIVILYNYDMDVSSNVYPSSLSSLHSFFTTAGKKIFRGLPCALVL